MALAVCLMGTGAPGQSTDNDLLKTYQLLHVGRGLTTGEVKGLERECKSKPDDLSGRTILLGYYFDRQFLSKTFQTAREAHILWIIQNNPDSFIAGLPEAGTDRYRDAGFYEAAKKEWLAQVEKNKDNLKVLSNAAEFLALDDKDTSIELVQKAQKADPKNAAWPRNLGRLYRLRALRNIEPAKSLYAKKSVVSYEEALNLTSDGSAKFSLLPSLATMAFTAGDMKRAWDYAQAMLKGADEFSHAGERGDALHYGNLVLGRIAFKSGDLPKAGDCLIRSGKTPGSRILDTFGPNMTLARELLEKGQKEPVLKYLRLCSKFWRDKGKLAQWTAQVKAGKTPDFGANLEY
jgi:hypothetical protein